MVVAMVKILNRIEQDNKWFNANFDWIQTKYEKQFVAIKDGKIIANAKTMEGIIEMLKKKGENPAQTFVSFIPEKNLIEIF